MSDAGRRRFGVFGGSFDPVHLGHLLAAQDACEQMQLDRVVFMPAAQAPLRDDAPRASAARRLALLHAAVAGDARFEVSTLEIDRGGVSYTIDTVRALRLAHPEVDWFWIIGADQTARLAQWREIDVLAGLTAFIVLARPGYTIPAAASPASLRLHPVSAHLFDVSSSEIRGRVAAGKPVRYFLPPSVGDAIERDQLYR